MHPLKKNRPLRRIVLASAVTVFIGSTPIGDAASADLVGKIIAALKVSKS